MLTIETYNLDSLIQEIHLDYQRFEGKTPKPQLCKQIFKQL